MASDQATPSSSDPYGGGVRGAGGKLKKPSARKPPPSPYDRPLPRQFRGSGWISKLVDGATRILPSLFSSKSPLPSPHDPDAEVEEIEDGENEGFPSNLGNSNFAEGTNTRKVEASSSRSDVEHFDRDKRNSLPDGTDFSKIEQLVKEREFSRDDVSRLVELLHSKLAEVSTVEAVGKSTNNFLQRESEGAVLAHESPQLSKGKHECFNGAGLGTPGPVLHSTVEEEVGASPVEIARAYMENRASEVSNVSKVTTSNYGGDLVRTDRYASRPAIPSPSYKPSVCWPGALVEERYGYSTPKSASRYGLHQFQRSPYSRSIYSKSKSKLARPEVDTYRFHITSPSLQKQPQTPIFGQSDRVHNDLKGSIGPIRRVRHKFSPRGSATYYSSQNGHSPSSSTQSFFPVTKNLGAGASKTTGDLKSVSPVVKSSESGLGAFQAPNPAIKTILEHLDRHIPTPKEKAAELKLATSAKKISSVNISDTNEGKSSVGDRLPERSEAADANKDIDRSSIFNGPYGSQRKSFSETTSFGLSNIKTKTTDKPSTSQNMTLNSTTSESFKKPPNHRVGAKPNLASISVDKPQLRQTISSDTNAAGFTFLVPSNSGALPDPPTPSIMPSITPSSPPQPKNDGPEIPRYTFGMNKSTPSLDFSFPSIENGSVQVEVSNLKFNFGSDKKRISFKSAGKDAVCF